MASKNSSREQVLEKLGRIKALADAPGGGEGSHADLEAEAAACFATLPRKKLTREQFESGKNFVGYLYNVGTRNYVGVDGDRVFLSANQSGVGGAVRWNLHRDGAGGLVLHTRVGHDNSYFNWRSVTGACKLHPSYDPIIARAWEGSTFVIRGTAPNQDVGTWSTSNKELYMRAANLPNKKFEFFYLAMDEFSADDWQIYDAGRHAG